LQRLMIPTNQGPQVRAAIQPDLQGNGDLVIIGFGFRANVAIQIFIRTSGPTVPPNTRTVPTNSDEFGNITHTDPGVCAAGNTTTTFQVSAQENVPGGRTSGVTQTQCGGS